MVTILIRGICVNNLKITTSGSAEVYTHTLVFICGSPVHFGRETSIPSLPISLGNNGKVHSQLQKQCNPIVF